MFKPSLSRDQLQHKFSKLQKLNYNPFRWWRMYGSPQKPLHPLSPLKEKILNGDYDYSHYGFQAMWCEHDINDIYNECYPDIGKFNEKTSMLRSRRKRLLDDFHKEETQMLESLAVDFSKNFSCSKKTALKEMEECVGSLIDLYYIMEDKYKRTFTPCPLPTRGRPKKVI